MLRKLGYLVVPVLIAVIAYAGFGAGADRALAGADPAREITVYNQNFALITQEIQAVLEPGSNYLQWTDLPPTADGQSFRIDWGPNGDKVRVREQNFTPGFSGQYELLAAHLGRRIGVTVEGGEELLGVLASAESGQILLETETGIVSINQDKVVKIRSLEPNPDYSVVPSLAARVFSDLATAQNVSARLSYLTHGLDWQGDYRLEYDRVSGVAHMDTWATVTNHSNFDYGTVKLRLVAGEVNTTPQPIPLAYDRAFKTAAAPEYAVSNDLATRSDFAIYHLYTINEPTELRARQTKQLRLAEAVAVPIEEQFIYDARINPREVGAKLVFTNNEEAGLGLPLPAGRVRVFIADQTGALRFAGEDNLKNLPQGAKAEITLGNAFGLTAERVQTELVRPTKDSRQESYRITIANGGDQAATVIVREHLDAGANWEIIKRSHKFTQTSATQVEFALTIPAGEEVSLEYTVRYLYQA